MQLLIVEDSADDAALLLSELKRNGHARRISGWKPRGVSGRLAESFVGRGHFRLCAAQFCGPEALRLLRLKDLDTPFIMISGIYGERKRWR